MHEIVTLISFVGKTWVTHKSKVRREYAVAVIPKSNVHKDSDFDEIVRGVIDMHISCVSYARGAI